MKIYYGVKYTLNKCRTCDNLNSNGNPSYLTLKTSSDSLFYEYDGNLAVNDKVFVVYDKILNKIVKIVKDESDITEEDDNKRPSYYIYSTNILDYDNPPWDK